MPFKIRVMSTKWEAADSASKLPLPFRDFDEVDKVDDADTVEAAEVNEEMTAVADL
jgi:hypothetical protein